MVLKFDKLVLKDGVFEEEAKFFIELGKMPIEAGLVYLRYIHEKGLMEDFNKWRGKRIFEVL